MSIISASIYSFYYHHKVKEMNQELLLVNEMNGILASKTHLNSMNKQNGLRTITIE